MAATDKILRLKAILQRSGSSCCPAGQMDPDVWVSSLLEQCEGNINKAAYLGCITLAKETGLRLPDGTTLPNDAPYWLRMAKVYRPSVSGVIPRADEGKAYG